MKKRWWRLKLVTAVVILWRKDDEGYFSPKLHVRIKDNDNSPHGKFHRLLCLFSSKFSGLNFTSYVLYIYLFMSRVTHSEPGLPMVIIDYKLLVYQSLKCMLYTNRRTCCAFFVITVICYLSVVKAAVTFNPTFLRLYTGRNTSIIPILDENRSKLISIGNNYSIKIGNHWKSMARFFVIIFIN